MRFEGRLISEFKEDNIRKFIISFFCGDDTIMVYQVSERNSGIWGGKFLEKQKHKNPITNQFYNQIDFQIGAIITLALYKFQLIRADEYTINYMEVES